MNAKNSRIAKAKESSAAFEADEIKSGLRNLQNSLRTTWKITSSNCKMTYKTIPFSRDIAKKDKIVVAQYSPRLLYDGFQRFVRLSSQAQLFTKLNELHGSCIRAFTGAKQCGFLSLGSSVYKRNDLIVVPRRH